MDCLCNLVSCSMVTLGISLLMMDFTFTILFTKTSPLKFQDIIFINHFYWFLNPFLVTKLFPFFPPHPFFPAFSTCRGIVCYTPNSLSFLVFSHLTSFFVFIHSFLSFQVGCFILCQPHLPSTNLRFYVDPSPLGEVRRPSNSSLSSNTSSEDVWVFRLELDSICPREGRIRGLEWGVKNWVAGRGGKMDPKPTKLAFELNTSIFFQFLIPRHPHETSDWGIRGHPQTTGVSMGWVLWGF